jgi:NADH-quinone oxidoreductase subunit N
MLQNLQNILSQTTWLYAEICLAILIIVQIILAAFSVSYRTCLAIFVGFIIANISLLAFLQYQLQHNLLASPLPFQLVTVYPETIPFKYLFAITVLLTLLLVHKELRIKKDGVFLALLATSLLGMNLALSTDHLLLMYLAIELVSLASYLLIMFNKTYKSSEAGIKYFLFGAATSGIMLYGISLLYGFSGTLWITEITKKIALTPSLPYYLAVIMALSGLLFKLVAAPVHTWVGDVYEGTATSLVAFLTTGSKFMGLAICYQIFNYANQIGIATQKTIIFLAFLSLILGTLGAVTQTNVKRLLAYSSVAHSGFLLSMLIANNILGNLLFYCLSYTLLVYLVFYAIVLVENQRGSLAIEAFAQMSKQNNLLAICLFIGFLGFAGLPPTAGFTAKVFVFLAVINSYTDSSQLINLSLIFVIVITSLIALFFYLKVPYFMFFRKSSYENNLITTPFDKFVLVTLSALAIILFMMPNIF